nr:hypothetical protein [Serratia marcescens]
MAGTRSFVAGGDGMIAMMFPRERVTAIRIMKLKRAVSAPDCGKRPNAEKIGTAAQIIITTYATPLAHGLCDAPLRWKASRRPAMSKQMIDVIQCMVISL